MILIVALSQTYWHPFENLPYCYLQKPKIKQLMTEERTKLEMLNFIGTIYERMRISDKYSFFYLKDGTRVNNIYDIPDEEITVFVS